MGILDKIKRDNSNKETTFGFYFGATEAEGEIKAGIQNFQYFFEDYLNILPQLQNGKFIFTGRKGAGKSAIAKYIKDTADKEENSFSDLIRLKDIEIEKIVQIEELESFEHKELIIFEWLILVRIIKLLILNKEGIYKKEYEKLTKFIERNSGVVGIDKFQISEMNLKQGIEVKFEVLQQAFPSFSKYFNKKTNKAPFYKLINPLKEVVSKILSFQNNDGKEFWLLFDDLDINFKENNQKDIDKITELIRISKIFNTEIFRNSGARILIFLRDDIKDILERHHTDTAKFFTSYEAELSWYNHEQFKIDEDKTALKRFINKRIEQNFKANKLEFSKSSPWNSLFVNDLNEFQQKTAFKYIIDFTYYRPRDLILFLKPIGENEYMYPIQPNIVKNLIKRYLNENLRELKNELAIYFDSNEISSLINVLRTMAQRYGPMSFSDLETEIGKYEFNKKTGEILKILSSYSITIPKDKQGQLHFNYREENSDSINIEECEFTTHKSIYNYFNPEKI